LETCAPGSGNPILTSLKHVDSLWTRERFDMGVSCLKGAKGVHGVLRKDVKGTIYPERPCAEASQRGTRGVECSGVYLWECVIASEIFTDRLSLSGVERTSRRHGRSAIATGSGVPDKVANRREHGGCSSLGDYFRGSTARKSPVLPRVNSASEPTTLRSLDSPRFE